MSDETSNEKPNELIWLDLQRHVTFKDGRGFSYTYRFQRITPAQWDRCFKAIEVSIENDENGGKIQKADGDTPAMDLVRSSVQCVEGYAGDMASHGADFRKFLPTGHVRTVADTLRDVATEPAGAGPINPFAFEVSLKATWGSADGMQLFSGLKHRFTPPSLEHERRLNRAMSETVVVGGSRTGKTIVPARHPVLAALYDELIESVEGYGVNGEPLSGRERIAEYMDGFHKFMAARALFASGMEAATL